MAIKRRERCQVSAVIGEMQVEAQVRCHCTPTRTAAIKKQGSQRVEMWRSWSSVHNWQELSVGKQPGSPSGS